MRAIPDMTGQEFGRLSVLGRAPNLGPFAAWFCRCECGVESTVRGSQLRQGKVRSCGCLTREAVTTHGRSKSPEYQVWRGILSRCLRPSEKSYGRYGGRGITVCERWLKFENFLADMGERPSPIHSIERRDNNGGYGPDNCVWATPKEQSRNRRAQQRSGSGVMGVYWNKAARKWKAHIKIDGGDIHLGSFDELAQAIDARRAAEAEHWGRVDA